MRLSTARSTFGRRTALACAGAAIASCAAFAASPAAEAQAQSVRPNTVNQIGCVSDPVNQYTGEIECNAFPSFGSGPYSFSPWTISDGYGSWTNNSGEWLDFLCSKGLHYSMTIVATDSTGVSQQLSAGVNCRGGNPQ